MAGELGERDPDGAVVFVQEVDDERVFVAVVLDDVVVHVYENPALLLFVYLNS